MKKYIFLDMDGVIATPETVIKGLWAITPSRQEMLGQILDKTGADIVLSSSWRHNTVEKTKEHMTKKKFAYVDKIVGVTIRAYHYVESGHGLNIPRGVEIDHWIDTHIHKDLKGDWSRKEIGVDFNYVILDDDGDMLLEQKDNFIQCKWNIGLTPELTQQAIEILNKVK